MAIVGVGVDTLAPQRMATALERTPRLLERVFTPGEQGRCTNPDGSPQPGRLAARFAAKEAVAKALGTGISGFAYADIEVANAPSGRPEVRLHRGAAAVAERLGVARVHISLSHDRTQTIAYAIAESDSAGSTAGH